MGRSTAAIIIFCTVGAGGEGEGERNKQHDCLVVGGGCGELCIEAESVRVLIDESKRLVKSTIILVSYLFFCSKRSALELLRFMYGETTW